MLDAAGDWQEVKAARLYGSASSLDHGGRDMS